MISDAEIERALQLLPAPLFRQRDSYAVARRLWGRGQEPRAVALWAELHDRGRIVRTGRPIGKSSGRWCYWQRTPRAVCVEPGGAQTMAFSL